MQQIAMFEKITFQRFAQDCAACLPDTDATRAYDAVKLPVRATAGSAGYDFFAPCDLTLAPGQSVRIPTAIRAKISEGWALCIFPRSGLGFKYRLQLDNTVGIIDSDYYHADNEGHIQIKVTNDSRDGKTLILHAGDAFAQGVFLPFGITQDDCAQGVRTGGFGSTSQNK